MITHASCCGFHEGDPWIGVFVTVITVSDRIAVIAFSVDFVDIIVFAALAVTIATTFTTAASTFFSTAAQTCVVGCIIVAATTAVFVFVSVSFYSSTNTARFGRISLRLEL